MIKLGVQTFTVRRAQKKDLRAAYLPLARLGIKSLEVARMDFNRKNARVLASVCDELGLEVKSIQVKPKYVFGAPDAIIEFCNTVGCKNVVISMLPFGCILGGEKRFYDFVNSLDKMADVYQKSGITLAYHHHNWEYVRLSSGKTRMQELLCRTSKIKFVHDTYWTARCAASPEVQISEFGERLLGIHLRDLTFYKKGLKVIPTDCALGEGVIDFAAVLRAAEAVGCSYYAIEEKTDEPYLEIEKSFKYITPIAARIAKGEGSYEE